MDNAQFVRNAAFTATLGLSIAFFITHAPRPVHSYMAAVVAIGVILGAALTPYLDDEEPRIATSLDYALFAAAYICMVVLSYLVASMQLRDLPTQRNLLLSAVACFGIFIMAAIWRPIIRNSNATPALTQVLAPVNHQPYKHKSNGALFRRRNSTLARVRHSV